MSIDLKVLNNYFNYKNEHIIEEKEGYYLQYLIKLRKEITEEEKCKVLAKLDNPYINKFIEIMKSNGKENVLNNLYSNLRITKIIDCEMIQNLIAKNSATYGGNYYIGGRILLLLGDKIKIDNYVVNLTPYHELLHLLTTRIENENVISIGISTNTFGEGLNEGYTEVLTKRYFGFLSEDEEDTYSIYKWYSEMIEEIIGKDVFEKSYFEANQDLLIKELAKYSNEKNVIEIISFIDYLFDNEDKIYTIEKEMLDDNMTRINELKMLHNESKMIRNIVFNKLITIHTNKIKKDLDNKEIDEKEYVIITNRFIDKNKKIKKEIDNYYDVYNEYIEESDLKDERESKWKSLKK